MKIALTGGIACGKSTLAKFLRELGIRLLDADDVVHELEAPKGLAVEAIVARFGQSVRAADGGIDRRALAEIVFSDPSARTVLESILFPYVRSRLLHFVSRQPAPLSPHPSTPNPQLSTFTPQPSTFTPQLSTFNLQPSPISPQFRISVIPLLFESHWEGDYDTIIAIASPETVQIERMMKTRGYSRKQAEDRLAAQMPVAEKVARADFVVINDSTPDKLKIEAGRLYAWLKERAKNEQ